MLVQKLLGEVSDKTEFADLRLQCLYLFLQIGDFSLNRLTFGRKLLVKDSRQFLVILFNFI